ncbi:hypothetical protein F4778DRAFT_780099 [Xylariomycetidae sp. FL2044]|nr:hypothetical protein F4778DRAFT_780099 [Xylariomycetidae sp. FL2044]
MKDKSQAASAAATQDSTPANTSGQQKIAYADLMRPDEDWRSLRNTAERRKIQNRIAQRAYRRNMQRKTSEVESLKKQLHILQKAGARNPYPSPRAGSPGEQQQDKENGPLQQENIDPSLWTTFPEHTTHPDISPIDLDPALLGQVADGRTNSRATTTQGIMSPPTRSTRNNSSGSSRSSVLAVEDTLTPTSPWPQLGQDVVDIADLSAFCMTGNPSLPPESDATRGAGSIMFSELSGLSSPVDEFPFDASQPFGQPAQQQQQQQLPPLPAAPTPAPLLHLATAGGHVETMKVLLRDADISINERDDAGFTPLQRAVMLGRTQIVSLLLEHGADVSCDELGGSQR